MVGVASETTQQWGTSGTHAHSHWRETYKDTMKWIYFQNSKQSDQQRKTAYHPSTVGARPHTSLPVALEIYLHVDLYSTQACNGHTSKDFSLKNNPLFLERSQLSALHSAEDGPKARSWRGIKTVIKHIFCLSSVLLCILNFTPLERWMQTGVLWVTPNCWKK